SHSKSLNDIASTSVSRVHHAVILHPKFDACRKNFSRHSICFPSAILPFAIPVRPICPLCPRLPDPVPESPLSESTFPALLISLRELKYTIIHLLKPGISSQFVPYYIINLAEILSC